MVRASHWWSEGCGFESGLGTQIYHHNNIYVRASIHLPTLIKTLLTISRHLLLFYLSLVELRRPESLSYTRPCLFHFKSSRQKETSLHVLHHMGRAKANFVSWLKIIIAFHADTMPVWFNIFGNRCGKLNHFNFWQRLPKAPGYICVAAQDMLHVRFPLSHRQRNEIWPVASPAREKNRMCITSFMCLRRIFYSPPPIFLPPARLIPPAFPCLLPSVKPRTKTNPSRKNQEVNLEQV